jgi:hypothetical protein
MANQSRKSTSAIRPLPSAQPMIPVVRFCGQSALVGNTSLALFCSQK